MEASSNCPLFSSKKKSKIIKSKSENKGWSVANLRRGKRCKIVV